MLDSRRLHIFREVARHGSFAAAASALHLSHSAVSQQMGALERTVGLTLFERRARGVDLTEAGHVLLTHAETVVDGLADAEAELQAVAGRRGGRLRFGCFPTATLAFGARLAESFRARYPEINFQYVDGEPFQSLVRLRQRDLDLALVFDFDRWPAGMDYDSGLACADDEVAYIELFDDPFFLVLPPAHRLAGQQTVTLASLRDERVLGYGPWGADLEHLCLELGYKPHFDASYHTADFDSFEAFVALGRGVTLMPGLALGVRNRTGVAVRPLHPAPIRHVKLAHRLNAHLSPAVEAMVEIIKDEIATPSFRRHLDPVSSGSGSPGSGKRAGNA